MAPPPAVAAPGAGGEARAVPVPLAALVSAALLALLLAPLGGGAAQAAAAHDHLLHGLLFAAAALAWRLAGAPWRLLWPLAIACAAATELLQAALPFGRHGDLRDLAADLAGIAGAWLATPAVLRLVRAAARPRIRGA